MEGAPSRFKGKQNLVCNLYSCLNLYRPIMLHAMLATVVCGIDASTT